MSLKDLIHRELGEGLTEEEFASAIEVPVQIVTDILADKLPKDPATWEKFARYFHIHADFLRSGGPPHLEGLFERTESTHHAFVGQVRKVPLLRWEQIDQMVGPGEPPRLIRAEAMIETTDVAGACTFALKVNDDSMEPLFSKGEMIFVNPDLPSEPGQYVVVESEDGCPEGGLLRQLKEIGGQPILHPLNRRHDDLPLTKFSRILGRVVRLRKNL